MRKPAMRSNYYEKYAFELNGVHYKSIRDCCTKNGISFESFRSYKYRTKSTTEETLRYYLDRKKEMEFTFRNRKWNSLKTCCDYYGLNIESVRNGAVQKGISIEQSIEDILAYRAAHEIVYKKKKYKSIQACCKEYGVNPVTVHAYIRKHNVRPAIAISRCIKAKQDKEFEYAGITYQNFASCCRAYRLNDKNVRIWAFKNSETLEHAIDHFQQVCISIDNGKIRVIEDFYRLSPSDRDENMHVFSSKSECCRYLEVNRNSLATRMRSGHSLEDSLNYLSHKKQLKLQKRSRLEDYMRNMRQSDSTIDSNKVLISVKEAHEITGLSERTIRKLIEDNNLVVRIGRRTMIHKKKFEKWLEAQFT